MTEGEPLMRLAALVSGEAERCADPSRQRTQRMLGVISGQEALFDRLRPIHQLSKLRIAQDICDDVDARACSFVLNLVREPNVDVPQLARAHREQAVSNREGNLLRGDDRDM